jgi:hypothetical protein
MLKPLILVILRRVLFFMEMVSKIVGIYQESKLLILFYFIQIMVLANLTLIKNKRIKKHLIKKELIYL